MIVCCTLACRPPDRSPDRQVRVSADQLTAEAKLPVVDFLLKTYPKLLLEINNHESTPLVTAAALCDDAHLPVLQRLLQDCKLETILDKQTQSGTTGACSRCFVWRQTPYPLWMQCSKGPRVLFCGMLRYGSRIAATFQHASRANHINSTCLVTSRHFLSADEAYVRACFAAGYLAYHIASQRGHVAAVREILKRMQELLKDFNKRKRKQKKEKEVRSIEDCIYDIPCRHYNGDVLRQVCAELGLPPPKRADGVAGQAPPEAAGAVVGGAPGAGAAAAAPVALTAADR